MGKLAQVRVALQGYKTYVAAALAVLGAVYAWQDGQLSDAQAGEVISLALMGAFLGAKVERVGNGHAAGPEAPPRPPRIPPGYGLLLALAATLVLAAPGCGTQAAYVAADRATWEAVAPEYRAYVEADPRLDDAQRARRRTTLETWARRIAEAEGRR